MQARAFLGVSMGRNGHSKVGRLMMGWFGLFQRALGHQCCLVLPNTWPWGNWGRKIVTQVVRA